MFAGVTYDLAETGGPAGYTASSWSCDGGAMSNNNTAVTVGLGEQVTCEITNDDVAPQLKLVKDVIGGDAVADDFTLSAITADVALLDRNVVTPGGSGAFQPVYAGTTYELSESGPSNYAARPWSCDGGMLVESTIELAPGDTVTCTVINDCLDTCPVQQQGTGDDVSCKGVLQGGTYNNVVVKPGHTCVLVDSYVNGTLTSDYGRNVLVYDTTIVGDVFLNHVTGDVIFGNKNGCNYDPAVGGKLTVKNSHNVLICQTTVCESVLLRNNDGRITVATSSMQRLKVVDNSRWEPDGPATHRRQSVIRLRSIDLDELIVHGNAPRKVLQRNIT